MQIVEEAQSRWRESQGQRLGWLKLSELRKGWEQVRSET